MHVIKIHDLSIRNEIQSMQSLNDKKKMSQHEKELTETNFLEHPIQYGIVGGN